MKALRNAKWTCNGTKYVLEAGKEVEIKKADEKQALASGLFETAKPKAAPKAK